MMMTLRQKIRNGQNVYGTCIVSSSPVWPRSVAGAGLDFVFLDTEHIPLSRTELAAMCQIYSAIGIPPLVRVAGPDPQLACMAVDAGASGVVFPYVETDKQVLELTGVTRYRPLKGAVLRNVLDGIQALSPGQERYLGKYNDGIVSIINIESIPALENLESLLSVKGLDAVIIGPHDLSVNMGLPEEYEHPEFEEAVRSVIRLSRSRGLGVGIHFPAHPHLQVRWMKEGANIVLHGSDLFLFARKLREDLDHIRASSGEIIQRQDENNIII